MRGEKKNSYVQLRFINVSSQRPEFSIHHKSSLRLHKRIQFLGQKNTYFFTIKEHIMLSELKRLHCMSGLSFG